MTTWKVAPPLALSLRPALAAVGSPVGAVLGALSLVFIGRRAATASDPDPAVRSGSLPYLPAIDGLRALAVTAVLLYHAEVGWMPGGFLGVEVFFVISGYLITSLLLSGREATGGGGLRQFWFRRARRLLPAVFTMIVALLAYAVIFLPDEVTGLRGDAAAAAGYVSNWYLIFDEQSYFEVFGRPSLLRHLWSLAVEEQFYLVWPVLVALVFGRMRPRYAVPLILSAAAGSAALMAFRYDPHSDASRLYYGTDTRLSGLLIGSALAFVWAPGRVPAALGRTTRHFGDAAGVIALAGLVACCVLIAESDAFLYRGGFALVGALTAVVIAAVVNPNSAVVPRLLGGRLLVWIGLRSYSIYLWHWPVFMLTRPNVDIALDGAALFALRIAIVLVLAEASYRLVETPVRRGALGRFWHWIATHPRPKFSPLALRPIATLVPGFAGVILLGMSVASADPPAPPSYLAAGEVHVTSWSEPNPSTSDETESPSATLAPTRTPRPSATPTWAATRPAATTVPRHTNAASETDAPAGDTPSPTDGVTPPPLPGGPTPLETPPTRILAVGDSVMLSASDALVENVSGLEIDAAVSRQVEDGIEVLRARRDAGTLGEVVIVHLGTNGSFRDGDFDAAMEVLSGVQRVVFVNLKVPRDWEEQNNAVIANGVAHYPNTVLLDWYNASVNQPGFFYEDGVHLEPDGATYYSQLIASYAR